MPETQTIQISEAIYEALMAESALRGLSVEELLRSLLPINGQTEAGGEAIGERLRRKGLIGIIDSSVSEPDSLPTHTAFGKLLRGKFEKQGIRFP